MNKPIDPTPEWFWDTLQEHGLKITGTTREEFVAEATARQKDRETVTEDEKRFRELLGRFNRPGTERLLDILKKNDFFTAPASVNFHNNVKGGLVRHSLDVYDCAMKERKNLLQKDPSLDKELTEEAVTVSALLHDVCKCDEYTIYPDGVAKHMESNFPLGGHGDKSVIYIFHWGFELNLEEILAIKWHMGSKNLRDKRDVTNCKKAMEILPLCRLIAKADHDAAQTSK